MLDVILSLFVTLWSRLPLAALHGIGALAGWLVWWLSPGYRAKFKRQAQAAGLTAAQQKAAIGHTGRWAAETPWIWFNPLEATANRVQCDAWSILDQAQALGKGVILLTPHLGSYEAAARAIASHVPMTVLYKPPKQAWLSKQLERGRAAKNLDTAPTTRAGVMQLLKTLKRGGVVGMLPDQVPGLGQGEWARVFGQPAYTMGLHVRLSQATGATILLVACERLAIGRGWRLHLRPMDQQTNVSIQSINDSMEAMILAMPEQYLWGYNRYRQPRDSSNDAASEAR